MSVNLAGSQDSDTGQIVRKPLGALRRDATLRPRAGAGNLVATTLTLTLTESVSVG
jgi:hypothetical protein